MDGMPDNFFEEQAVEYEFMLFHLKDAFARGQIQLARPSVDETLSRHGLSAPHDSPEYRLLAYEFLRESVLLWQRLNARQRGEVVVAVPASERSPLEMPSFNHSASPLISKVFERWAAERKPLAKTLAEWRVIFIDSRRCTATYAQAKLHAVTS
jgi:hypothetical protein